MYWVLLRGGSEIKSFFFWFRGSNFRRLSVVKRNAFFFLLACLLVLGFVV